MADKVFINGNQYDYGSTELKIAAEPIYGYTAVNWSQKRERQKGRGAGKDRRPKGQTGGRYEADVVKVTVRRDTASQIKLMLAEQVDGSNYGNAVVPIVLQYVEDESNQDPVMVEFFDCTYQDDTNATEEEGGPDSVEISFSVQWIDETINGKKVTLYDSSQG